MLETLANVCTWMQLSLGVHGYYVHMLGYVKGCTEATLGSGLVKYLYVLLM